MTKNKYSIYQEVELNNTIDLTLTIVAIGTGLQPHEQRQVKTRVCKELEIECFEIKKFPELEE